jgi:putative ABC transport system permease protein
MVTAPIVDYDFFRTMDVELLAGREFERSNGDDVALRNGVGNVVIDRTLAKEYGWMNPHDAIGKSVYMPSSAGKGAVGIPRKVIGVVENRTLYPMTFIGGAATMYSLDPARVSFLVVRVSKNDIAGAGAVMDKIWNQLAPNVPFRRKFLDEQFEAVYRQMTASVSLLPVIAVLSVLVGAMGLVGIASYAVTQRRFEIGVRRTLGASVRQVFIMLLKDFSKPILVANAIGWPFAFLYSRFYAGYFVDRVPVTIGPFAASLLLGLGIAWLAVLRQSINAARMNPATVLRHE